MSKRTWTVLRVASLSRPLAIYIGDPPEPLRSTVVRLTKVITEERGSPPLDRYVLEDEEGRPLANSFGSVEEAMEAAAAIGIPVGCWQPNSRAER